MRGQALVETALVLPIFLLVLFGLVDGGRFVYTDSVMSQAAREGARLASVEALWIKTNTPVPNDPSCVATAGAINPGVNPGAHVCPATTAVLLGDVKTAANRMTAGVGQISQVDLRCDPASSPPAAGWVADLNSCANRKADDIVSVRVVYLYGPITPIVGQIIGKVSRSGVASMAIN
jgi:hypothetical protein